jgi:hypothetical protein
MNKISVIGLDIEDYYGNAIENIDFDEALEIDPELFNVRVDNFCLSGTEEEGDDFIIRIQYEHEMPSGNIEEIDEIHSQIMEILLLGCDENLENEKEISKKIFKSLEMLL